jgi:hypothetical protein
VRSQPSAELAIWHDYLGCPVGTHPVLAAYSLSCAGLRRGEA